MLNRLVAVANDNNTGSGGFGTQPLPTRLMALLADFTISQTGRSERRRHHQRLHRLHAWCYKQYLLCSNNVNDTNALVVTLTNATGALGSFGFLKNAGGVDAGEGGIVNVYDAGNQLNSTTVANDTQTTLIIVNDNATGEERHR